MSIIGPRPLLVRYLPCQDFDKLVTLDFICQGPIKAKVQKEYIQFLEHNCSRSFRRSIRYWKTKRDCSGLRLNMPVRMMCSLSEGELIMRFPWRAVLN